LLKKACLQRQNIPEKHMKSNRLYLIAFLLPVLFFCKKTEQAQTDSPAKADEKKVARYKVALYKEAGSTKSWVATLNRGEEVTVVRSEEIETGKEPNLKKVEYVLVKIAGGKEGYVEARHLAKGIVIIKSGKAKIYNRPIVTSGEGTGSSNIPSSMIAFIEGEDFQDGAWLEVVGGHWPKTYFKGWMRAEETLKDDNLVLSALKLEDLALAYYAAKSRNDLDKVVAKLEDFANESEPLATRARELKEGAEERAMKLEEASQKESEAKEQEAEKPESKSE
jgi:lipoprotein LenA